MHLQWWRSVFYAVVCTVKLTQEMSRRRQHEDASLWLWRQRDDFELFETSSILLFGVLPGSTALESPRPRRPATTRIGRWVQGRARAADRWMESMIALID